MDITIKGLIDGKNEARATIEQLPDKCPYCHIAIQPVPLYSLYTQANKWSIFMFCPNRKCNRTFIAYYSTANYGHATQYTGKTSFGTVSGREFPDEINSISPSFTKIYNQAYGAEQQDLLEICGVGYRKALEFLIKDYAIKNHPAEQEKIEKKLLAQCINEYVSDDRIKSVSKRAVWLGNDETHFVRKWEGKNLVDLKKLIDLTLHWIEAEVLTGSFEEEMPD